jgi:hypothetical protein
MELKPYYSIEEISNAITGLPMPVPQAIKTDALRYAIPAEFGGPLLQYPTDTLAPALQQKIQAIRARAKPNEARSIHADASCCTGKELLDETLYLKHSSLNQCVSGKTYFAHTLETFDGRPVNLWSTELATDQMWLTVWLELTELGTLIEKDDWFNGLLSNGLISTKELVAITNQRPEFPTSKKQATALQDTAPFKRPQRTDETALAIITLGNFYVQKFGKIPEDSAVLRQFMINTEYDGWTTVDQPSGLTGHIKVGGQPPISYSAFEKRFDRYLDNGGQ